MVERGARPDYRAARRTARNLVESWGIEAAEQRKLATEYRDHMLELADQLRALQVGDGADRHWCEVCERAAESKAATAKGETE